MNSNKFKINFSNSKKKKNSINFISNVYDNKGENSGVYIVFNFMLFCVNNINVE